MEMWEPPEGPYYFSLLINFHPFPTKTFFVSFLIINGWKFMAYNADGRFSAAAGASPPPGGLLLRSVHPTLRGRSFYFCAFVAPPAPKPLGMPLVEKYGG